MEVILGELLIDKESQFQEEHHVVINFWEIGA